MEPQPSTSGVKRKRNVLTIEKKLEIIKELNKGVSAVTLSGQFQVPRTTINDIKKNADHIQKFASQMETHDGQPKQRKTMKKAANEALDEALYLWFVQKRSEGIPLSGPLVAEKALFFNSKLNGDQNFRASVGWLSNFKKRHGIRELNIQGEKMSAATAETVNEFKDKFEQMIKENGLTRDQVYNADEFGLNYKALPKKTLAACSEKYAPGFKMQKQRITGMACANASGNNRLPLLLIGTAKKPRCFKGINMNALPVHYYAQKNAWMNQSIFTHWFKNVFIPYVQRDLKSKNLPPKAVLVLDNAPSHPEADSLKTDDGSIFCYFLPPNTTSLIQPMDQSVIETFKRRYRKQFMQRLVIEEEVSLMDYWKSYNLKHVVNNASDAWDKLSMQTLQKSWNQLWPISTEPCQSSELCESTESHSNEVETITSEILAQSNTAFRSNEFSTNLDHDEIIEWLQCDSTQMGYQLLTDDEIIESLNEEENTNTEIDVDYDGSETQDVVSKKDERKEACQAAANIENFMEWYIHQDDANNIDTMLLRRLRNLALKKSETPMKQTKITEFIE